MSLLGDDEDASARPSVDRGGDGLAGSAHTPHLDIEEPHSDFDPHRSEAVCAAITRAVLRDLAPALMLLDRRTRVRAQAIVAYAATLFDFTRDHSLEGERLSQINRWQYALEAALAQEPLGQPVFVMMAAEEARRPWPREALDRLAVPARARITGAGKSHRQARDEEVAAATTALLGDADTEAPNESMAAVIGLLQTIERALSLVGPPEDLVFRRAGLTTETLTPGSPWPEPMATEIATLRASLLEPTVPAGPPPQVRRALGFARRGALVLLDGLGDRVVVEAPVLGLFARVWLLVVARLRG